MMLWGKHLKNTSLELGSSKVTCNISDQFIGADQGSLEGGSNPRMGGSFSTFYLIFLNFSKKLK